MVSQDSLKELQQLAARSSSREICGLISVHQKIYPITNVSTDPNSFLMSKKEYGSALNAIRDTGDSLLAVYHSHPVSAVPSEKDLQYFQKSGVDMLIVTPEQWRYYVHD